MIETIIDCIITFEGEVLCCVLGVAFVVFMLGGAVVVHIAVPVVIVRWIVRKIRRCPTTTAPGKGDSP